MEPLEVEVKEEPIFEEFDADMSEDIKEELDDDVKPEMYGEPKYEVVEEELVSYDLLEPHIYTVINEVDDGVSLVPVSLESPVIPNEAALDLQAEIIEAKPKRKKMVQCKVCKSKFFSHRTLKLHEETHKDNTNFTCEKCMETFPSLGLLMEHQKEKMHFKVTDPFQERAQALAKKKYKCRSCGLVFYSEKTFRFHVKIHAGLLKYSCDVCEQMFNTLSDLAVHRESLSHGMKCHECGTICPTVHKMDQHVKMHTKWKFFKCKDCNFSTVVQRHLRQHRATSCPGLGKEEACPVMCGSCNTLFENQDIYLKHNCPMTDVIKPEEPFVMDGNVITMSVLQNRGDIEIHHDVADVIL